MPDDRSFEITFTTKADAGGAKAVTEEVKRLTTATKEAAAETKKTAEGTDRWNLSKRNLIGSFKALQHEIPVLGQAIRVITNPFTLFAVAIAAVIAKAKQLSAEISELLKPREYSALSDPIAKLNKFIESMQAFAAAAPDMMKAFGDSVKERLGDLDKLQAEAMAQLELEKELALARADAEQNPEVRAKRKAGIEAQFGRARLGMMEPDAQRKILEEAIVQEKAAAVEAAAHQQIDLEPAKKKKFLADQRLEDINRRMFEASQTEPELEAWINEQGKFGHKKPASERVVSLLQGAPGPGKFTTYEGYYSYLRGEAAARTKAAVEERPGAVREADMATNDLGELMLKREGAEGRFQGAAMRSLDYQRQLQELNRRAGVSGRAERTRENITATTGQNAQIDVAQKGQDTLAREIARAREGFFRSMGREREQWVTYLQQLTQQFDANATQLEALRGGRKNKL